MIKGIGIDIIELDRIESSLEKNKRLIERILTPEEREYFHNLRSMRRQIEFLAGRFAAKEAFAKATGRGIGKLSFQHINVMPRENGAPHIIAEGYENDKVWLSISHSKKYAIAQVIIES